MNGVAFSGRAGSGKSTLARSVVGELENRGYDATILSFADTIKAEVLELYGLVKHDPGGREALIEHGESKRDTDPDYWVNDLVHRARELEGHVIVVDDLRRPNEFLALRRLGFYLCRVKTEPKLREWRLSSQGLDPTFAYSCHDTEVALDAYLFDRSCHISDRRQLRWAAAGLVDRLESAEYVSKDLQAKAREKVA